MSNAAKIVIIEKHLSPGGHNETQLRAMKRLVPDRPFTVIASRDAPSYHSSSGTILAVLASNRERKRDTPAAIRRDAQAILRVHRDGLAPSGAPALTPSADIYDLRVTLELFRQVSELWPFHVRLLTEAAAAKLAPHEFQFLRQLISQQKVALLTETAALSDRLRDKFGLPSRPDLLLPCSIDPEAPVAGPPHAAEGRYKVAYLGALRKDKGSTLIPEILRELSKRLQRPGRPVQIDFVMQAHRTSPFRLDRGLYDMRLFASRAGLFERASRLRVERTGAFLTGEEFVSTLRAASVVLVPYDLDSYRFRGSGIVIDGVLALKPIVFTSGIAMSDFLEFGNAKAASSPAGFAESILNVIENIGDYQAKAPLARDALKLRIGAAAAYLNCI